MTITYPIGTIIQHDGVSELISSQELLAGMVKAPSLLPSGEPLALAGLNAWVGALLPFHQVGFHGVEIHDGWLPFPQFTPSEVDTLRTALAETSLRAPSVAIARKSVIEPGLEDSHLEYTLRGLEVAHELGASLVCLGLHPILTTAQKATNLFWSEPGRKDSTDPETWATAVRHLKAIARRAETLGLEVSLELYEDTLLGTVDSCLKLLSDIDSPIVGLNPDIGNLLRLDRPVDHWRELLEALLPASNYWHVKNYTRVETASGFQIEPTTLENGVIDYPQALALAEQGGFDGLIVCEQYSDDWLEVLQANRIFLEGLLASPTPARAEK